MKFDIVTIFPQILDSYINESILKRAREKGLIDLKFWNLRDYTTDRHRSVDDTPYSGGPGMIYKIEPIWNCLIDIVGKKNLKSQIANRKSTSKKLKVIMLSPRGQMFSQTMAVELVKCERLVLIAGRYEGIDARVEQLVDEQISIGPYVLSGGELPAMVVVEAVARLLPGVLGSAESLSIESFNQKNDAPGSHLIEYPQYTRPEVFEPIKGVKWPVPEVLLSGDHKKIEEWRKSKLKMKK